VGVIREANTDLETDDATFGRRYGRRSLVRIEGPKKRSRR
jgi:hypothetical protein